jgi:hypothetical protein
MGRKPASGIAAGLRGPEGGRIAEDQLAHIDWMEAVDILARIDAAHHRVGIDVGRQRGLDEDAVDRRVAVETIDDCEQFLRARFGRQDDGLRVHPGLAAGLPLGAHIHL